MMHQINFLPWRQKRLKLRCQKWGALLCLQIILWALFLVLITMQQTNSIEQHREQFMHVKHQLAQLQRSIKETEQSVQQHHDLAQRLRKKQVFMAQNQRYLQLFRQLPHLLPAKSWLTAFNDDSGQLVFTAYSQNHTEISDFMDNLANDPTLINVQLKKMITAEDQIKVFTIDADWLAGGIRGK
ncbi:type IV pilus biogenesis protein PilN [Xenorhabdus mauleonii]|uniref:Pilus assembly protein HofN n=1 Tax=Xenorhabdus mauleonii TaxID=351675 RepID=A0A1I3PPF6_9GAMM|nr:PilN domain-containing protein [Xenorhabdus mauleonii]PHM44724.1 type IV pilus biogenesis protein PilN [Xenorhabdus mauleonii]SFJ23664.1 pilus assembly protein HofN [Xenorhabdus mauleonii]